MNSCGRCHACGGPIETFVDEEYCPGPCCSYQQPLRHGWTNPTPTDAEQLRCDEIVTNNRDIGSPDSTTQMPTDDPLKKPNIWEDAEIISVYTRRQAIEDGTLVAVSPHTYRSFGIKYSVALTRTVWEDYVSVPPDVQDFQDKEGRLSDILSMFALSACECAGQHLLFQVIVKQDARETLPAPITLKAVIDGGDDGQGAITIMLPNES